MSALRLGAAFGDQPGSLGMQQQRPAERLRRRLPGDVVRRRADAAEGEHQVRRGEALLQRVGQHLLVVADVARPGEAEAAVGEDLDQLHQVLVAALTGQDLVAHDERPDAAYFPGLPGLAGVARHVLLRCGPSACPVRGRESTRRRRLP
jgi:hypothetical protein